MMTEMPKYPFADQGNRLRLVRLAEKIPTGVLFAQKLGWGQSGYSQFETGARQIPVPKVRAMATGQIPGFDAQWLWTGDKRGLGFDLRRRIEAIEEAEKAAEMNSNDQPLAGSEG
jgi:hypothetical protein